MNSRDRAAAVVVSTAMAIAAFAIGSAPRWAACLTAMLCLASVIPLLTSRRRLEQRPLLLLFLGLAAGLTALQALPLPSFVVGLISPHRLDLAVANAEAWGHDVPALLPLSYDPPGTLVELGKLAGYFAFAYTCLRLAQSSRGRRWLMISVAAVGAAMAITALGHHVAGTRKLFGLYQPSFPAPPYMAPLLNPNHLAGLLAFCAPVALGLAAASLGARRVTWLGVAALCAGVGFLTQSRGGAIALVVGGASVGALLWLRNRRGMQEAEVHLPRAVIIPAVIIMACALSLLVAFTAGGVAQELSRTTTEELSGSQYKLEAWRSSQKLMYRNPWTGVGRGAFEFAFTRVHPSGEKTYSHVENEYLQTLIDWGVPGAALLGVVLAMMVMAAARRSMTGPLEAGALGGLIALGLHNFVDFNLQFPAVALPALAGIAVVLPGRLRESREPRRRQRIRAGVLVAGLAVVALAASPLASTAKGEATDLDADLDDERASNDDLVARGEALTGRHPSDYVSFGMAARALFRKGDSRAIKIMNRALDLNPEHSGLHWLAAQMMGATTKGQEQALVEYGLALRTAVNPRPILAEMLARFPDVQTAARALPSDPELAEKIAYELSIVGRADVALAYVQRLHDDIPDSSELAGLVADYALLLGKTDLALAAAKQAFDRDHGARNAVRWGRALTAAGRTDEAERMIDEAIVQVRSRGTRKELVALLTLLGDVQRIRGKLDEAKETLSSASDLASDRKATAAVYRAQAQVEDALGNPHVAAVLRQRAERLDPSDTDSGTGTATPTDAGTPVATDGGVPAATDAGVPAATDAGVGRPADAGTRP